MDKKQIRREFKEEVFKRDKCTCQVCGTVRNESELDAHHITDRELMPYQGYSRFNGITVCKEGCHMLVEQYHLTDGRKWEEGLHPNDLYAKIDTTYKIAFNHCELLSQYANYKIWKR